ncbi:MAG: EF-P lysine aminoacylase EpmA [Dehalococcoidia bacterium]|nr:EF-P lysine aminoacylase EpmA [Dehalococcoidia bacterium]
MPSSGLLRRNLEIRAQILEAIRLFFRGNGFLEVETPVRYPCPAPELHIEAFKSEDWYLSTSPELHMKRLLAEGYQKIFQISKCFRRGERGRLHNPEFTMLEWYRTDADYMGMLSDMENMVLYICSRLGRPWQVEYRGTVVDLSVPWPRISVKEAFERFAGWTPGPSPDSDRFDVDLVDKVEPSLDRGRPTVLFDYPASLCSLARIKADNPEVAERLEVYIGGMELANAFSELTDEVEQRQRFTIENEKRRLLGRVPYPIPERFLSAVGQMPESGGCALGVDRLVMLFCDAASIDEVLTFTVETA